ncbi:MAG: phosphatase PAP2 family protein [Deltaproteobacteria bacterium]|nr:phosphatase PAP2 family protein [Deltaproteobacteria bacterium]
MNRIWAHLRSLWPRYPLLPSLPLPAYCLLMAAMGMLRWDHLVLAGIFLVLAYAHRRTQQFLVAFMGFFAIALLYDSGRFIRNLGVSEDRVFNCGMHELELAWFGLTDGHARVTLQDYFQVHHHPALDLFFAVPYGVFIAVSVLYSAYLFFIDKRACQRFGWAFFVLNVFGIVTYHLMPAAPPWYFHKFGCAIQLDVSAYEGNALARVDAMTGLYYFRGFYGRAAEVFGALPSLHVAYPLLMVFDGWRRNGRVSRGLSLFYFVWMCCAAVYLDHHWIPDLLLGWAYTGVVFVALRKLMPDAAAEPQLGPAPSLALRP